MTDNIEDILKINQELPTKPSKTDDILMFRTMVAPILIQILFWIGVIGSVVAGISQIAQGLDRYRGDGIQVAIGIGIIIVGPIVIRLNCELAIIFFRINETLTEIKNKTK